MYHEDPDEIDAIWQASIDALWLDPPQELVDARRRVAAELKALGIDEVR